MCGRFALKTPPEALREIFATTNPVPNFPARYNFAPTQDILAVRRNPETGERSLDVLRWGLIPHWAADPRVGTRLINARAEGIEDKPAFRDAFRRRRCLIPADAFYEWRRGTKPKQPYAIRRADHAPFAMAGLWENWRSPEGAWIRTATIITTAASDLVAPLHDRMPVILRPADHARWLGEAPAEPAVLKAMLAPLPAAGGMVAYPVGLAVNDVRNDGAALLEPLT